MGKLKEFEYKYRVDGIFEQEIIAAVKTVFPDVSIRHIVYEDFYYIPKEYTPDLEVPMVARLRKNISGDGTNELTIKSLSGCGEGERNELNVGVESPEGADLLMTLLKHKKVATLHKSCTFLSTEHLSITFDIIRENGAHFFEIEVRNPNVKDPLKLLNKAEKALMKKLPIGSDKRIDDLLFEIYSGYRLLRPS